MTLPDTKTRLSLPYAFVHCTTRTDMELAPAMTEALLEDNSQTCEALATQRKAAKPSQSLLFALAKYANGKCRELNVDAM